MLFDLLEVESEMHVLREQITQKKAEGERELRKKDRMEKARARARAGPPPSPPPPPLHSSAYCRGPCALRLSPSREPAGEAQAAAPPVCFSFLFPASRSLFFSIFFSFFFFLSFLFCALQEMRDLRALLDDRALDLKQKQLAVQQAEEQAQRIEAMLREQK